MHKNKAKTGVLLVNVGTPDSTSTADVRKYLREFLMDKRVIDIPQLCRWFLIIFIVAPFRAPKSAIEYKMLWTVSGSPLLFHAEDLRDKLMARLDKDQFQVEIAMRYQAPNIERGLEPLRKANVKKIIFLPLFRQNASASTGTVADKVMEITQQWQVIPSMTLIHDIVDHPMFLE